MSINYPGGYDSFPVPSLPEETSLSEAGTATRNHTEHHADLGAAVVALEQNTALRNHDHSGGTGIGGSAKLSQANTHENADTDSSELALHHSLGTGAYQAAPGNHTHDYNALLNRPVINCTSTTRPPNPVIGQRIWETDTNRERVWAAFQSNTSVQGMYGGDTFDRVSNTSLGSTYWTQTYTQGAGHGLMATPDGHSASWIDQGSTTTTCIARRVHPSDKVTLTDDQSVTMKIGSAMEQVLPFTDSASNDIYLRFSEDGLSYIRVIIEDGVIYIKTTTNGRPGETQIGALHLFTRGSNIEWRVNVIERTVSVYRNDSYVGGAVDADAISNKGAEYRGWGFGMVAGARVFGQATPGDVEDLTIQDVVYYTSTNKWSLLSTGSIPVLRLQQSTRQPIAAGSVGSIIEWRTKLEDTFGFFNPNQSMTDITVKEAGLYWVNAAIAWDPGNMADHAMVGIEINGLDTIYKDWTYVRGGLFTPGFSQTIKVIAPIRFAEGDILRVRGKHNKDFEIFSYSSTAPKQDTHLEMTYISP